MTTPAGHVVVAPDKFKGSLTATEVAEHVAAGLRRRRPGLDVRLAPVADGGDGTVDAVLAHGFRPVACRVTGPTGHPVDARIAVRDDVAVIELAQASGLVRLPGGRPDPLGATSAGTGEMIRAALDAGCRHLVLGLGGSACTDGGAGMASALGLRLLGRAGRPLPGGGAELTDLDRVDAEGWDPRLAGVVVEVASDVDNPLLGPSGAAAVYGPQKGASPDDVARLEAGLARWAAVLGGAAGEHATRAGAGAAGGVGFAAMALLGAAVRPGIDLVLDLVGFGALLPGSRLVVTGEGSLDAQTLHGKAPVGVARAAARAGVPTVAVSGRRSLTTGQLASADLAAAYALTDLEPDLARCLAEAGPLLEDVAARLADDWLDTRPARPHHTAPGGS